MIFTTKIIPLLMCLIALVTSSVFASELSIPRINVVDKFGVNLANGQVSQSLETLSIGGAMGISHSISGFTNSFSFASYRGYHDKYRTKGMFSQLSPVDNLTGATNNSLWAYKVSDPGESAAFLIYVNGAIAPRGSNLPSPSATYVALTDTRHTLEVDTDPRYLKWTKPDGTVVRFNRGASLTSAQAASLSLQTESNLEAVIYPNGFTVTVEGTLPSSVRTNTGFLLKYNYGTYSTVLDKTDSYIPGLPSTTEWDRNPMSITGVNVAKEPCSTVGCNLANTWPTATFTWPSGMPRSLYINYPISPAHPTLESGVFSVRDAKGRTTEYHYQSQDLKKNCLGETIAGFTPVPSVNPRLVGIKTADSKTVNVTYNYCNVIRVDISSPLLPPEYITDSEIGIVRGATKYDEGTTYSLGKPISGSTDLHNSGGGDVRAVDTRGNFAGDLSYVDTIEGRYFYEVNGGVHGWRNFLQQYRPHVGNAGVGITYGYDARGNLTSICRNGQCSTAGYPTSCTNPKTCNQATWIKDANQNQTDYTYHAASGQVETVTSPADKNGVRAQTRYEYTALNASYYDASNTRISGSAMYLKTAERRCTKTNYSGIGNGASLFTGSCGAGDQEVVTRYEYSSTNLFLTGILAIADNKTLRTCFQYDIYGNQVGKSQPKSGIPSCPQL